MDDKNRTRGIFEVTLTGSAVNLLLVVMKFVAGIVGRSAAMVADAVHSLSDLLSDIIVLVCTKISGKPQDEDHDYGHGKYETLATLAIGVLLFFAATNIFINAADLIKASINGEEIPRPGMIALIVAAASILLKEGLYHYTVWRGKALMSKAVIANAWHHRSDAFSSIGTLLGIAGAMFLGEKWRILDPIAAIVVGAFIVDASYKIIRPALDELLEKSLPLLTENEITEIMLTTPGVERMHRLRTRRIGNSIAIEAHLKMDGELSLREAHAIASEVEKRLREKYGAETHIGLHMEPA